MNQCNICSFRQTRTFISHGEHALTGLVATLGHRPRWRRIVRRDLLRVRVATVWYVATHSEFVVQVSIAFHLQSTLLLGIARVIEYQAAALLVDVQHLGMLHKDTKQTQPTTLCKNKRVHDITHQLIEIAQSLEYTPNTQPWVEFTHATHPATPPSTASRSESVRSSPHQRSASAVSARAAPLESSPQRHTSPGAWTSPPVDIPPVSSPAQMHTSALLTPLYESDTDVLPGVLDLSGEIAGGERTLCRQGIRLCDILDMVEVPRSANRRKRIRLCPVDRMTTHADWPEPLGVKPRFLPRTGDIKSAPLHRLCALRLTREAMQRVVVSNSISTPRRAPCAAANRTLLCGAKQSAQSEGRRGACTPSGSRRRNALHRCG